MDIMSIRRRRQARRQIELARLRYLMAENQARLADIRRREAEPCRFCLAMEEARG